MMRDFVGEIDLIGKQRTLRRGPRQLAAWLLARGSSSLAADRLSMVEEAPHRREAL